MITICIVLFCEFLSIVIVDYCTSMNIGFTIKVKYYEQKKLKACNYNGLWKKMI